jgi:hypothetical protein
MMIILQLSMKEMTSGTFPSLLLHLYSENRMAIIMVSALDVLDRGMTLLETYVGSLPRITSSMDQYRPKRSTDI